MSDVGNQARHRGCVKARPRRSAMVARLQPCTPNTPDSPWAARRGSKTEAQIMNDLRRMSGDFDSSDGDSPPSSSGDDVAAPHIEKRGTRKIRRTNSERGWDRRSRRKKTRSGSGSGADGSGGAAGPRLKDVGRQDSDGGSNLLERRLQRGRGGGATARGGTAGRQGVRAARRHSPPHEAAVRWNFGSPPLTQFEVPL